MDETPDNQSGPNWLAIRSAYERGDGTIKALCKMHNINTKMLYEKAKTEHWMMRETRNVRGASTPEEKQTAEEEKEKAVKDKGSTDKKTLISRLYSVFERQMAEFENNLIDAHDTEVTEKDARTLGSLARTLEKLIELRGEAELDEKIAAKEVDIDRLREEITSRIERLRQRRGSE